MKIYCHDGIAPSVEVLNQYGIRIQDEFKIVNENGRKAYIIELPENLRLVHKGDLPQIISQFFDSVIVDENENIISSLALSKVNYEYEVENVPVDKMYDYHCWGVANFYQTAYPSASQLETLCRQDLDKFAQTIEEMRTVSFEENLKLK